MIKVVVAIVTAFIVALAYAALDDITTNPQPSYTAEYAWLAVTAAWMVMLGVAAFRRFRREPKM